MSFTKIVATLGPASDSEEKIKNLILVGVNVFRFNLKHNTQEWHSVRIARVRKISQEINIPVAILLDMQGPEIRIGTFTHGELLIVKGEKIYFVIQPTGQDRKEIVINNLTLLKKLNKNNQIRIDNGHFHFHVIDKKENEVACEALSSGVLKNQKGVNVPDLELDLPTLISKDIEDISMASREDVDYIALSFVRSKQDILILRQELKRQNVNAKIIAKIETSQAINNFEEILEETDGVMVARGDLGIEKPIEEVPFYQKYIIKRCLEVGKPVITATQMLESMMELPTPTRAEVSDVANAIYDFSDALMLSGETASGNYPVESVKMMKKISEFTEKKRPQPKGYDFEMDGQTEAITHAAYNLANSQFCKLEKIDYFIALTETGSTARKLARLRANIPIIAVTGSKKVRDELLLVWGVTPLLYSTNNFRTDEENNFSHIIKYLKGEKIIKKGENVIVISGEKHFNISKSSSIKIQKVD